MSQIVVRKNDKEVEKKMNEKKEEEDTVGTMECLYFTDCGSQTSSYCPEYGVAVCCQDCQDKYYDFQKVRESDTTPKGKPDITSFVHLWYLHVSLMRQFIIFSMRDLVHDPVEQSDSIKYKSKELMKNQEDIGQMIGEFLKDDQFGESITQLLLEHVSLTDEIVKEYLKDKYNSHPQADLNESYTPAIELINKDLATKWSDNAKAISSILSRRLHLNSYGKPNVLNIQEAMMHHLTQINIEMIDEIMNKYADSLVTFEEEVLHIKDFARKLGNLLKSDGGMSK